MPTTVTPLGAVVAGTCERQIPSVCMFGEKPGALLTFAEELSGRQVAVCKACSEYLFATGEWTQPGQKTLPASLVNYIRATQDAKDTAGRLEAAARHHTDRWMLYMPITAGDYRGEYWVADVQLPYLGWIRVALFAGEEQTPSAVEVRPVRDRPEYEATDGAVLFMTKRTMLRDQETTRRIRQIILDWIEQVRGWTREKKERLASELNHAEAIEYADGSWDIVLPSNDRPGLAIRQLGPSEWLRAMVRVVDSEGHGSDLNAGEEIGRSTPFLNLG